MPDCPICSGSLEYYDSEVLADAEEVGDIKIVRYRGWCPICKKDYVWYAEYELKASYGLSEG